jgi:hypothetical protein
MASIRSSPAVLPGNISAVPQLLSEIAARGDDLQSGGDVALEPRLELLSKARELVAALETPRETMIRDIWTEVSNRLMVAVSPEADLELSQHT